MLNPPTGTHNVSISLIGGGNSKVVIGAISYTGVNQTNPLNGFKGNSGQNNLSIVFIDSEPGDLVQDGMSSLSNGAPTVGGNQTQRWSMDMGGGNFGTGSTENGSSNVTMSWDLTEATKRWAILAFNINAYQQANLPPNIQLNSPENNSFFSTNSILLNTTVSDPEAQNMTVWFFWNGSLINSSSNIANNSIVLFNWTSLAEGLHSWNAKVSDGLLNTSSGDYFFTVDTTPPQSNHPSDASYNQGSSATIPWILTDSYSTGHYYVLRNGTLLDSNPIQEISAGLWNFTVLRKDNQNYTNYYDEEPFLLNKYFTNLSLSANPGFYVNYPTETTVTGGNCPGNLDCNLYLDEIVVENPNTQTLDKGIYNYTYSTSGNENYTGDTKTQNLIVNPPPIAVLGAPGDNFTTNETSVAFEFKCSDNLGVSYIQLWTNVTGSWIPSYTNNSYANDTLLNITIENISMNNLYTWQVYCNDSTDLYDLSANRTFSLDNESPNVTLNTPENNYSFSPGTETVTLTWVVRDNLDSNILCNAHTGANNLVTCSNNTLCGKTISVSPGYYSWHVTCSDGLNEQTTEERTFSVQQRTNGGGGGGGGGGTVPNINQSNQTNQSDSDEANLSNGTSILPITGDIVFSPGDKVEISGSLGETINFKLVYGNKEIDYQAQILNITDGESATILITPNPTVYHVKKGSPLKADLDKNSFDDTIIEFAGVEDSKAVFQFRRISEGEAVCGNQICEESETTESCPKDCAVEQKKEVSIISVADIGQWAIVGIMCGLVTYIIIARTRARINKRKYFWGLKISKY